MSNREPGSDQLGLAIIFGMMRVINHRPMANSINLGGVHRCVPRMRDQTLGLDADPGAADEWGIHRGDRGERLLIPLDFNGADGGPRCWPPGGCRSA